MYHINANPTLVHRILTTLALCILPTWCGAALPLEQIHLPPGFHISLFADHVPDARSMALGPDGIVFVGSRRAGKVYALIDRNGDGRAEQQFVIASGLNMPNGVAYRDGSLYVAAVDRILRLDHIAQRLHDPPAPIVVNDQLPAERSHGWRYLRFGPDGWLYVPVGAPCNICLRQGYAEIRRLQADGSGMETYARGIRNTVGFDWDPRNGELWFTDNGRDGLGDNQPPDELNHAPHKGMHFGYPFCHGRNISDPEFGKLHACREFTPPVLDLGAHVAALGMRFYSGNAFPKSYRQRVFIAEHGSWDRSSKVGYRIVMVDIKNGKAVQTHVFASGWLQGQQAWGRPVDILVMPDGALLVSDDRAGVIYRISYRASAGG